MPLEIPDSLIAAEAAKMQPAVVRKQKADHGPMHKIGWPVGMAGGIVDAVGTVLASGRPNTVEKNPLWRGIDDKPAVFIPARIAAQAGLLYLIDKIFADQSPKAAALIASIMGGAHTAYGLNNALRVGKQKK